LDFPLRLVYPSIPVLDDPIRFGWNTWVNQPDVLALPYQCLAPFMINTFLEMIRTSFHLEILISRWKHLDIRSVDCSAPEGELLCKLGKAERLDLKLRSPSGDRIKLSPETIF
jgi:hypothetical protein